VVEEIHSQGPVLDWENGVVAGVPRGREKDRFAFMFAFAGVPVGSDTNDEDSPFELDSPEVKRRGMAILPDLSHAA